MVDSLHLIVSLPRSRLDQVNSILALYTTFKHRTYIRFWIRILGTLCILFLTIPGRDGIFCHLQADIFCTRCAPLTPAIHAKLNN